MSAPFQVYRHGHPIVPADAPNLTVQYNEIYCLTAGNLVLRLLEPITGANSDVTIPMVAGQTIRACPILVKVATTGTYLGLVSS